MGKTITTHLRMVYTTYLWWYNGEWFIIVLPTLVWIQAVINHHSSDVALRSLRNLSKYAEKSGCSNPKKDRKVKSYKTSGKSPFYISWGLYNIGCFVYIYIIRWLWLRKVMNVGRKPLNVVDRIGFNKIFFCLNLIDNNKN